MLFSLPERWHLIGINIKSNKQYRDRVIEEINLLFISMISFLSRDKNEIG
jgi:hypothetical protein